MASGNSGHPKPLDPRYFVEAVERGLKILEAFPDDTTALSLAEIVAYTGLDKTTAFRLAYTFEALGYLQRQPHSRKYRLGWKAVPRETTFAPDEHLLSLAGPVLDRLFERTGESADLAVRDGTDAVFVLLRTARHLKVPYYRKGLRAPLHASSSGKALIFDMTPDEVRDLIGEGPYVRTGPNTISSLDSLIPDLVAARQRGYAVSDEEMVAGLRGLAVPVRHPSGDVVAAISVTVRADAMPRAGLEANIAPLVVLAAREVSSRLGEQAV